MSYSISNAGVVALSSPAEDNFDHWRLNTGQTSITSKKHSYVFERSTPGTLDLKAGKEMTCYMALLSVNNVDSSSKFVQLYWQSDLVNIIRTRP